MLSVKSGDHSFILLSFIFFYIRWFSPLLELLPSILSVRSAPYSPPDAPADIWQGSGRSVL